MAQDNETESSGGPSRRDLLKKLGVAAGALVWATPVVQTIATGIAGAQQVCADISHLDVIASSSSDPSGTRYGIQWDPSGGWTKHPNDPGHCIDGMNWTQPSTFDPNLLPTPKLDKSTGSYTVTFPSGAVIHAAFSKAGQGCQPAVNTSGNTWRFDKWCTSPTTTTTTTSTTTTSTTVATTTTTAAPTTTTSTTTAGGGGGAVGSPGPGKDISHMDFILCRKGSKPNCNERYAVQYTPGREGWGPHPSGPSVDEHCIGDSNWRQPPNSFSFSGFGSAVALGGGAYRITLPADVTVHGAWAKCGQLCGRALHLGGNTWRFDPCV